MTLFKPIIGKVKKTGIFFRLSWERGHQGPTLEMPSKKKLGCCSFFPLKVKDNPILLKFMVDGKKDSQVSAEQDSSKFIRISLTRPSLPCRGQFCSSAYRQIQLSFSLTLQGDKVQSYSCLSEEFLVVWSMHAHKPKFPANPWTTLDVSMEFPASISTGSLPSVSRAI